MKIYFFKKPLLGEFAKWIIYQSPFIPKNLLQILADVEPQIDKFFDTVIPNMYEAKDEAYLKWGLNTIVKTTPSIQELNISKAKKEQGVKYHDKENSGFVGTDRYSTIHPDHDFVDLDALLSNICHSLISEQEKTDIVQVK